MCDTSLSRARVGYVIKLQPSMGFYSKFTPVAFSSLVVVEISFNSYILVYKFFTE